MWRGIGATNAFGCGGTASTNPLARLTSHGVVSPTHRAPAKTTAVVPMPASLVGRSRVEYCGKAAIAGHCGVQVWKHRCGGECRSGALCFGALHSPLARRQVRDERQAWRGTSSEGSGEHGAQNLMMSASPKRPIMVSNMALLKHRRKRPATRPGKLRGEAPTSPLRTTCGCGAGKLLTHIQSNLETHCT